MQALTRDTRAAVARCPDEAGAMRALRLMKQEAALLIALADIGGVWDLAKVTGALTEIADVAVQAALRRLLRDGGGRAATWLRPIPTSRKSAAAISCWRWARWAPAS